MHGLYPIIDLDALEARRIPVLDFCRSLLAAGLPQVQFRAKHASPSETLTWLRTLLPLCRDAGTLLFANDRPDLAVMGGCDGVHVGQTDLSVPEVRRVAPGLRVGVSTHSPAQLRRALDQRPDYVAYGPVFTTSSKQQPDPVVGVDGLTEAARAAAAAGCPLVAIGGIDLARAPSISKLGVAGAVIGALLPPDGELDQVQERAQALHRALEAFA